MSQNLSTPIDSSNIEVVRHYIQQQFDQRSWWPTEGPLKAQADFAERQGSPDGLTAWCNRWLNTAQRLALDKAVRAASGSPV